MIGQALYSLSFLWPLWKKEGRRRLDITKPLIFFNSPIHSMERGRGFSFNKAPPLSSFLGIL
jgi:hypothetical protein